MKRWVINILQYIVNSIESEEDKTLPEDYFKDIIIKKGESTGQAYFQKFLVADNDKADGIRTGGFGSTTK